MVCSLLWFMIKSRDACGGNNVWQNKTFMLKGYTKSLKKVAGNRRDIYTYYLNV